MPLIYQDHPKISAILITLLPNAMEFEVSDTEVDTRTIPECYIVLRNIYTVKFDVQYNDVRKASQLLWLDNPVIFIKNNCKIVVGRSLLDSFNTLEVAEYSAKGVMASRELREIRKIFVPEIEEIQRFFVCKSP